jgi:hypothetical protein
LRPLRVAVLFALVLGLAACGSKNIGSTVMPQVKGQQLDVAESNIKSAGFEGDVKVVGGGTFGVVDKSNWQVCDQSPGAGQAVTTAPRLTVDRSCGDSSAPTATSQPAPTESKDEQTLTVKNNKDLAALLQVKDPGDPSVAAFANKYDGRTIEFDGNIAWVGPHGNYKTREDVLIFAGDYNANYSIGPQFELSSVSTLNVPGQGYVGERYVGENIRIKATVSEYESLPQLFQLDPFSVTITDRN